MNSNSKNSDFKKIGVANTLSPFYQIYVEIL